MPVGEEHLRLPFLIWQAAKEHLRLPETSSLRTLCESAARIAVNEYAAMPSMPARLDTAAEMYGYVRETDLVAFTPAHSSTEVIIHSHPIT